MWDISAGYAGMETRGQERNGGEWIGGGDEMSSSIVWLLSVSSVDLLCSQPQALASASSTAPCISLSEEPI